MKKLLSTLLIIGLVAGGYWAYTNYFEYGKRIKINSNLEVYIKGKDVTDEEAKKLGNFFAETWKENKQEKSLQLMKQNGTYIVKMVVDEKKLKEDPSLDVSFMAIRILIEEQVFKGSKVKLTLTDDHMKDVRSFDENTQPRTKDATDSSTVK